VTLSRKIINFFRAGDLGFIAVVIVSYASAIATAGYAPRAFTPSRLGLLILAGLAYVIAGTLWFGRCRRMEKPHWTAAYFAFQLLVLVEPLTSRELEILSLIARGDSNKEIAVELLIAEGTF
jgi:DNA-binding NarL/FixJ family response regulator